MSVLSYGSKKSYFCFSQCKLSRCVPTKGKLINTHGQRELCCKRFRRSEIIVFLSWQHQNVSVFHYHNNQHK
ncbi:hypothetical protein QE152_g19032 [Popillia japonica]|uniref:Uncharacterized protein n=1 Tax=Popillia japonica TaxID=7064 RepID=A0AAW1L429_POPJA